MDLIASPAAMTVWAREKIAAGKTIGLVPTMGFFHAGHLALMRQAGECADHVVVSLFVNPLQFGPQEDLGKYPRDLDRDLAMVAEESVDVVFAPSVAEMYPQEPSTRVVVSDITESLCGARRPGHFEGVATVVAKLFNIVKPHLAVFGRKDLQQLAVIRRMVRDLNWDLEIIGHPIIREADGLAMSSRNKYLNPDDRLAALNLHRAINQACDLVGKGERDAGVLADAVQAFLERDKRISLDYVSIVDQHTLEFKSVVDHDAVLAIAAVVGSTRLIDNELLLAVS